MYHSSDESDQCKKLNHETQTRTKILIRYRPSPDLSCCLSTFIYIPSSSFNVIFILLDLLDDDNGYRPGKRVR